MSSTRLAFFALALVVAGRFTVDALSPEEKDMLKIARVATDKTYELDTMHEVLTVDFSTEGFFALFGSRLEIGAKLFEDRAQRRNADGTHDVYAKTSNSATMGGFPIGAYKMDELVLNGVAWARLVEGTYSEGEVEAPEGWFKPAEVGLNDLQEEVMYQLVQASGREVKDCLVEENVLAIEETVDNNPDTRCFKTTPTDAFKDKLLGEQIEDDTESLNEKAVVHQMFCVEGGFLVKLGTDMEAEGYDTEEATDVSTNATVRNDYVKFNEPIDFPDPTAY